MKYFCSSRSAAKLLIEFLPEKNPIQKNFPITLLFCCCRKTFGKFYLKNIQEIDYSNITFIEWKNIYNDICDWSIKIDEINNVNLFIFMNLISVPVLIILKMGIL